MKCHCNRLYTYGDFLGDVNSDESTDVGKFDDKNHCENFIPLCDPLLNTNFGLNVKCRLSYCRENDSVDCFFSAAADEKCKDTDSKTKFRSQNPTFSDSTKHKLGTPKIKLIDTYYGEVCIKDWYENIYLISLNTPSICVRLSLKTQLGKWTAAKVLLQLI